MIIKSNTPLSFLPNPLLLLATIVPLKLYIMPCSDYPDFILTSSIPLITSTISTTSISSPSSITDTLPIVEPSIRPVSPVSYIPPC